MGQDTVVSQQPLSRVFGSKTWKATKHGASLYRYSVVSGKEDVGALQPLLSDLCRKTGQAGAMDWLRHLVQSPTSLKKRPYVVLVGRANRVPMQTDSDSLLGAVLIYEYRLGGLPTGIFATDDINGMRTVLAAPEARSEMAHLASAHLMRRNAAMVFITFNGEPTGKTGTEPTAVNIQTAVRARTVPTRLALDQSLDATLAQLGARTRRNLRYYRRRACSELGAQFVPLARLTLEEFLELNRGSTHPLSSEEALWRHELLERSMRQQATLCAGMRAADGQWLSLIWGRRNQGIAELEWQLNRAADSTHSFSIAMRTLLMEHEIATGTTELRFIGGTQHSISAFCAEEAMTDLLAVRRSSVRALVLRHFVQRLLPDANFLRGALEDTKMMLAPRVSRARVWAGLRIF